MSMQGSVCFRAPIITPPKPRFAAAYSRAHEGWGRLSAVLSNLAGPQGEGEGMAAEIRQGLSQPT